eukprot:1739439-Amphidinium_carterae.1
MHRGLIKILAAELVPSNRQRRTALSAGLQACCPASCDDRILKQDAAAARQREAEDSLADAELEDDKGSVEAPWL